jgi:hypothetical protein
MFEFHCRCKDSLWESIDQIVVDEAARIRAELDIQPDGIEPEKEERRSSHLENSVARMVRCAPGIPEKAVNFCVKSDFSQIR